MIRGVHWSGEIARSVGWRITRLCQNRMRRFSVRIVECGIVHRSFVCGCRVDGNGLVLCKTHHRMRVSDG